MTKDYLLEQLNNFLDYIVSHGIIAKKALSLLSSSQTESDNDEIKIKVLDELTDGKGDENPMPPKYKDGSFRQRGNVLEYRFVNLKKYYSVYGQTKEICWNKRTDIITKSIIESTKKKEPVEENKQIEYTYGDFLNMYLEKKRNTKPPLSTSAIESIERCIRLHISDELKKCKLREIKPYMLENNLNNIETGRTREYVYTVFTGSLRWAKANDLISTEIWKLIDHPKYKANSYRPLEDSEYQLLLEKAKPELKRYIIGYCWTGCRRNELLSIRYKDIDEEKLCVWDQKTKKWKYIPLFPPLRAVISHGKPEEKVFKHCSHWVNTEIRNLCDSLKLYDITTHSLRNTFGSVLYDAGVDIKDIQAWLGHNTLKVTQDIYTKRRKKSMDESISKLVKTMFNTHNNTHN